MEISYPGIIRRYFSGIKNLFKLYIQICNYWILIDNSNPTLELIAEGSFEKEIIIKNNSKFEQLKSILNDRK